MIKISLLGHRRDTSTGLFDLSSWQVAVLASSLRKWQKIQHKIFFRENINEISKLLILSEKSGVQHIIGESPKFYKKPL